MNEKNLGVLIAPPRPKDFLLGSATSIIVERRINDWSIYLPALESQRNKITDFLDCVTISMIHSIEMQLNYLLATNQLSDEALYFFNNNGYINNGFFELSVRFNATLNGTDKTKGQYLNVASDCLRRDGFIPMSDWPVLDDTTWDGFYSMIPVGLFSKAKKALWFVDIKYQWINKENFRSSLLTSPIQVATAICSGWDSGNTVQKCSGQPLQHSTLIYGIDEVDRWLDLDHYSPYLQKLYLDYEFPLNMQYIVTPKPLTLRNGMHGSNVLQLQKDLNKLGFILKEDSDFGNKTQTQVISFQNKTGLKADGVAGPLTLKKLKDTLETPSILDIIKDTCLLYKISPELGIAVATAESNLNSKCINKNTNGTIDRGLFQWNDKYHPEITDTMAFDPQKSTQEFCKALLQNKKNLHNYWSASEHNWKKMVSVEILQEYNIK